jgi:hypothetical protein
MMRLRFGWSACQLLLKYEADSGPLAKLGASEMASPADNLDSLRLLRQKEDRRFRERQYQDAQDVMKNVVQMWLKPRELEEFVKRNGISPEKSKKKKRGWLIYAAFEVVFGAASWKPARGTEFLHQFKKVPVDQLAGQIRKSGGFEKLVALASKEDPRRVKQDRGGKEGKEERSRDNGSDQPIIGQTDDVASQAQGQLPPSSLIVTIEDDLIAKLKDFSSITPVAMIGFSIGGEGEPLIFEVRDVKKRRLRWGSRTPN